ncbi:ABC transporter permease [Variovorax sp. M-6]|uniref:ABC transporter permease n=1 Tax=Variovorax sp. M-6 TaxID=3233041 RepID=UPI003F9B1241
MTPELSCTPSAPPSALRRRAARSRDDWALLGLCSPALGIVSVFLLIPLAWLVWLSFRSADGFTLQNYARLVTDEAYIRSLWLTLRLSVTVTALCVLLGYPLCYMLAHMRPLAARLCLLLVIVPFWTSLLVRTYAWLVLLQRKGIINNALLSSGLIDEPLYLVHNPTGALIGMFHIMLPFFVLPLYSALKRIDPDYLKASASLGASQLETFWRVYFPLSRPGLVAGGMLVLILCFGFYITPALLGGGKTLVIPMLIERNVNLFFEWGAASSVAVVFLVAVLLLFAAINRLLSVERLFGGA